MVLTLDDEGLTGPERKVIRDVAEHGLHVVNILPEADTPGWAFTVGLFHSYGHPELVVFGLKREMAHSILNLAADEARAGRSLEPGTETDALLEGFRCAIRPVHPRWHEPFLGYARWFYEREGFPCLQVLWPDREQRYPWDLGAGDGFVRMQPLLYHEDPAEARVVELLASMELDPGA